MTNLKLVITSMLIISEERTSSLENKDRYWLLQECSILVVSTVLDKNLLRRGRVLKSDKLRANSAPQYQLLSRLLA